MSEKVKVILNPYSARWNSLKRRDEVEMALREAGVSYDLAITETAGHATVLAAEAVRQGYKTIAAAGGDGTIGEVVNGMVQAAGKGKLANFGIMPLGTANDLVDNLGLPKDLLLAAKVIASGKTRPMDLCQVNERIFANNAGIGLESYVSVLQNQMTRVQGIVRYLLAAFKGIGHNPQWRMKLEWDDGEHEGPVTLVSVGNAARTGGIFYTVPHADPFDGKLSFVYGYIPTKIKILQAFPKIMKAGEGNYVEHPDIHEIHCTWLKVEVEPATPAHADGEVFDPAIRSLEYRILPERLPMLLGE
ncbi:MAG: diacylglycerol kinase family lipid kinase [Anaerolineae bacterium]|nr:diacylglycerol kinase family lipid kinase [Anaerolineae bacterium]